jgi:hypothetical protein
VALDFAVAHDSGHAVALHELRKESEHTGVGDKFGQGWVTHFSADKLAAMIALGLQEIKRTYLDVENPEDGSEFCSPNELNYIAKWLLATNNEMMRQLHQPEQILVVDGLNDDARRPLVPDDGLSHDASTFHVVTQPAAMSHQSATEMKIYV